MRSFADLVAFNAANPHRALRFGQDIFLAAAATRGDLSEPEYLAARRLDLLHSRTLGIDAYMDRHRLDAVLFPGATGCAIAAKAGYPSVLVPAGFISGIQGRETPPYPLGATFTGRAWSEATSCCAWPTPSNRPTGAPPARLVAAAASGKLPLRPRRRTRVLEWMFFERSATSHHRRARTSSAPAPGRGELERLAQCRVRGRQAWAS